MARPRTPTNVIDARGGVRAHPERAREDPPTEALKPPGAHITGAVLANWHEITRIAPAGVITEADRVGLEMLCSLLAEFRQSPYDFPAPKLVRLEVLLGKFGMTPSDRAKVATKPKPKVDDDPFEGL